MDLTAPHHKVDGGKLGNVRHVDVNDGLSIGDVNGLILLAGDCDMVVRCNFETKKKMRKEGGGGGRKRKIGILSS